MKWFSKLDLKAGYHQIWLLPRVVTRYRIQTSHILVKKNVLFVWIFQHQQAFDGLKQALVSASVSALPDFSVPFCIYTNACKSGIGAVLMQKGHPLAFLSKVLGPKNQGFSTYKKE